jgi:hypothetical protein
MAYTSESSARDPDGTGNFRLMNFMGKPKSPRDPDGTGTSARKISGTVNLHGGTSTRDPDGNGKNERKKNKNIATKIIR